MAIINSDISVLRQHNVTVHPSSVTYFYSLCLATEGCQAELTRGVAQNYFFLGGV